MTTRIRMYPMGATRAQRLWIDIRWSRPVVRILNWFGMRLVKWRCRNMTAEQMIAVLIVSTAPDGDVSKVEWGKASDYVRENVKPIVEEIISHDHAN